MDTRTIGNASIRFQVLLLLYFPLIFGTLQAQENIPRVQVHIQSSDLSLNQVLDEITLQTGYLFTYDASLFEGKRTIRLKALDWPLKQVLDSVFRDEEISYRLIDRNIVIYRENIRPSPLMDPSLDRVFLRGKVMDMMSGKALSYATVALHGSSLGTITNQEGEFSFKIPGDLINPMMIVSYMGYQRKMVPIKYPLHGRLTIELEKETIPLQEVIIRYTDPALLLSEAIRRIPENYPQDHASMTAFYRESVQRDEHYLIYTEAVLDIAKGPYTWLGARDKASIQKRRRITDVTAEDTIMVKLRSGITSSLSLDIIKNKTDFLEPDFQLRYDLEFRDMITYNDQLVFVIGFQPKAYTEELFFEGKIYMDQENLAILAADFEYPARMLRKRPELFLVSKSRKLQIRPLQARYHAEYRSMGEQFVLSQVRAELAMKVRKRRKWFSSKYQVGIEMAITDITPGQKLEIEPGNRVSRSQVLADEPFVFDPLFWGIHNSIEPEASLLESISKLEFNRQEIEE